MRPHQIKNAKPWLFKESASVPREFCLLLTGNLLQNSTEELWDILKFKDYDKFVSKEALTEFFGKLTGTKQVSDLHTVLIPYLL